MPRRAVEIDGVVAALEDDGYAIVEGMLSPEEVAAARADLRRVLAEIPGGRNDFEGYKTQRVYALFAKTRAFDKPALDPLVTGVLERILGHSQFSAPTGIQIGPGEKAQVLHTDDGIYPIARPHDHLVLNTMWALDDFTEQNGATRLIPGSHKWVEMPGASTDLEALTIQAVMPAGSVIFYLGSLVHGGGANRTDRPRLGVILEFVVSWLRAQENHMVGVPKAIARDLPERLQELLGYNVRPPFLGYADGRHPRRVAFGD
ncbi:MAG: phytanoyl-CoA dioxygenase family protein [Actinobacteria bacterium]|nr:phytanoyl-CoA dioxygenase family protein [Actinomycetota bacterium]